MTFPAPKEWVLELGDLCDENGDVILQETQELVDEHIAELKREVAENYNGRCLENAWAVAFLRAAKYSVPK